MKGKIIVWCNCASMEEANRVAHGIVNKRLAACVNIVPAIHSVYRWQGKIEEATEVQLMIKTRRELFADLETEIRSLHSYSVPEIIAVPIELGSQPYLDWIDEETGVL